MERESGVDIEKRNLLAANLLPTETGAVSLVSLAWVGPPRRRDHPTPPPASSKTTVRRSLWREGRKRERKREKLF
jgi:hypothetical protein